MMKMKKVLALLTSLAIGTAILASCASSNPNSSSSSPSESKKVMKIGHMLADNHPQHKILEQIAETVKQETNGSLTIEIYPNSILGADEPMLDQVRMGSLEAVYLLGGPYYASAIDGRGNIEELPFLFPDIESARRAYDGEFGEYCKNELIEPNLNVKVLDFWESGFRQFTNDVRPIYTPSDMVGIKFRIPASEIRIWTFEALGANGIPMAWPEVFTGLQQGTIQGQENPIHVVTTAKLYEVQKYLSLCNYVYSTSMICVNPTWYDTLTDNEKTALQNALESGRDLCRQSNIEENQAIIEEVKKLGMEVNEIDFDAFFEAVQPAWDKFRDTYGSELIDLALESSQA